MTVSEPVTNTGGGTVSLVAAGVNQSVVSDGTWKLSTSSDSGGASGTWAGPFRPGSQPLPAAGTYTNGVVVGYAGGIDGSDETGVGGGAKALKANGGTFFYRSTFNLASVAGLKADLTLSVDNDAQVFINGQEVARETDFDGANFSSPFEHLTINPDGSISNVRFFNLTNNFTGWVAGVNEIVIAVRNPDGEGANSGGFVFRMDLGSASDVTLAAPVTSNGGNVNLTASGAVTETGAGVVGTAGTLTTGSASGQTLNGANAVGSFNATNSPGGNVSLVNTAATLSVTGVSQTGGTTTVSNTGSLSVTGAVTSSGNVQFTATQNLTVGAAVSSTGGSTTLSFGQDNAGRTALLNAGVSGSPAKVLGGGGADGFTVNATAAGTVTLDGQGAGDTYTVNAGGAQLGTAAVADSGVSGTDQAFVNGTAGDDTFNMDNPTAGAGTITVSTARVTYTNTLEQATLSGTTGGDTYTIDFANPARPARGCLRSGCG